MMWQS